MVASQLVLGRVGEWPHHREMLDVARKREGAVCILQQRDRFPRSAKGEVTMCLAVHRLQTNLGPSHPFVEQPEFDAQLEDPLDGRVNGLGRSPARQPVTKLAEPSELQATPSRTDLTASYTSGNRLFRSRIRTDFGRM